jgi:hypothetical protein
MTSIVDTYLASSAEPTDQNRDFNASNGRRSTIRRAAKDLELPRGWQERHDTEDPTTVSDWELGSG